MISAAICTFPTVTDAVDTVIQIIQAGIPVARIELLDELSIEAVNAYSKMNLKVAPTLFFEFHGTAASVREQAEMAAGFAEEHGGAGFEWTENQEARNKLWAARHTAFYAGLATRPGSKGLATDVCVPISRLAEAIGETKKDLADTTVPVAIVGHVGDGNFHLCFVLDPNKPEEFAQAERINDRMVTRALAMGGTCTGEHGVGYGKIGYLEAEHGADTLDVMRRIKQALDPKGLMNPGKILAM
jgi:D-lactate dehydrogenase (cytochrome)